MNLFTKINGRLIVRYCTNKKLVPRAMRSFLLSSTRFRLEIFRFLHSGIKSPAPRPTSIIAVCFVNPRGSSQSLSFHSIFLHSDTLLKLTFDLYLYAVLIRIIIVANLSINQ